MNNNQLVLPLEGLSREIQDVIKHFAQVKKSPTNFVATSLFAVVGGVAGKRLQIVDGGYSNFGQVYACLVGVPGSAKSPAMDVVTEAVTKIDYENYLTYKRELQEWKNLKDNSIEKPTIKKVICDDVTTEKLMTILSENDNGILMHCDELTDLTANLNRYSTGDNLPKFLKMWSNGAVRVDRKGDEPLMVQRPFLSVLSSTQPINLWRIFGKHQGTGFFARWLFTLPNDKPDSKAEPNQVYFSFWERVIKSIRELPPMTLHYSEDVLPQLQAFDDSRQVATDTIAHSNPEFAECLIKSCYTVRRLSVIIHLISAESNIVNGVLSPFVTADEFHYAEKLTEFYEKCSAAILDMMTEKRMEKMTDKRLLQEFNERFHPTNISELARLIGKSQQYVSKCILGQSTANEEKQMQRTKSASQQICQYIENHCPRLMQIEGLPDDDAIDAMQCCAKNDLQTIRDVLSLIEQTDNIQNLRGSIYTILFSQLMQANK